MEPWDPLDHPARIEVRRQESDDSDAEGGLGNVTRVVLRPPGHSGKAKRGHLCFDASFEGGNLGRVDFVSEYEYDLFIRPDTCNPRYRLWFNFVVDNVRVDQRVIFNLVNLSKTNTLFRDGMTPLVKTSSRPKWQRLAEKYVYYHRSPEHRNHVILSFAFAFDREEDVYQFALSFPYSYSRLQSHLTLLQAKDWPFLRRETIANSLQGRQMDVLTITSGEAFLGGRRPKVVVVMGRSHPGESATSFVIQGLLDFLLSSHPTAVFLRDYLIIKIIPMINPDGVFMGNYRCTLMGYDLNRHWNQVSPWAHPTLHALKNYLAEMDANKGLELDMVIDVHTHTSLLGAFIYGNSYDDVYRFERHILFPKLLAHNCEDYNPTHTMYNRDPLKIGTARRHLCEILRKTVNVYTLQVSIWGYHQPGTGNMVHYNEDGYFRLGRNLARTLFEYYKVTGLLPATALLPTTPSATETEKKPTLRRSRPSRGGNRPRPRPPSLDNAPRSKTVLELTALTRERSTEDGSDCDDNGDSSSSQRSTSPTPGQSPAQIEPETVRTTRRLPRRTRNNLFPRLHSSGSRSKSPSPDSTPKRPAYKTFDFSILKNVEYLSPRRSKYTNLNQGAVPSLRVGGGRKIGGGGIVGKAGPPAGRSEGRAGPRPSRELKAMPSLTIIDFNKLIRAGLENRLRIGRERKARGRAVLARTNPGLRPTPWFRRKNHCVRRRLAMVLRGNVTDCSPWEDDSASETSEGYRNHSAPPPLLRRNLSHESKHSDM